MKRIIFTAAFVQAIAFTAFAQINSCPKIDISTPNHLLVPGKSVVVTAKVDKVSKEENLNYEWTVSAGKILKGQGTAEIEFVLSEEEEDDVVNIHVDLTVTGLSKNCLNTASDIMGVALPLIGDPLDFFGKIALDVYKARVDGLRSALGNDPDAEALISVRLNQNDSPATKASSLKKALKALEFLKVDLTRITFAVSESESEEFTTFWIIPEGAEFPKHTKKDHKIIKAEELRQKIDELFPRE